MSRIVKTRLTNSRVASDQKDTSTCSRHLTYGVVGEFVLVAKEEDFRRTRVELGKVELCEVDCSVAVSICVDDIEPVAAP